MSEKIYEMTHEGIEELREELERRKAITTSEIADRLKEAISLGDLSENSEYDDAKEAQAKNEFRMAEIEGILKNAKIIEAAAISHSVITLGSKVIIQDLGTMEEFNLTVVSAREEDILKKKLSSESPVGAAILGKKKGEVVSVKTPVGYIEYKIIKISRH